MAAVNYAQLHRALRRRILPERAWLLQADEFPDPARVSRWALWLEKALRRLEAARAIGDLRELKATLRTARRIVG